MFFVIFWTALVRYTWLSNSSRFFFPTISTFGCFWSQWPTSLAVTSGCPTMRCGRLPSRSDVNNMNTNVPHAWLSSYSVIVLSKIQCYQGIACHMTERPHGSHTNWMCGQCPWQSLPKSPKCFQICQHHEWCVCVFWSLGWSNTCPPTVPTSCTGANSCKVNSCSPTRGTRPSSKCWKAWSVALAMNLGSSIPSMKIIIIIIIIIINH